MSGQVTLVGAGPGAADLLTLRAASALVRADVVFYDTLVSHEVLDLAFRAQRFCVGKRAGRRSTSQETIHSLLIRAARRGRRVVRLKGGDPFVFGRGGEEALALAAAGIPFEIVPGLSSALTAPSLCGIPVTHRSLSSSFLVVSGHAEQAWRPLLSSLPPRSTTVVVLMGLASRDAISRALVAAGWAPSTPAAVVWAASTSREQGWLGTLAGLASARPEHDPLDAPGTLVIGDVVSLATALRAAQAPEERGEMHAC
jgi:uroporphyrin-III C-methyltransferase / precorrin-2 dehydrogenase / sirohydrochlorin ferrochelatase